MLAGARIRPLDHEVVLDARAAWSDEIGARLERVDAGTSALPAKERAALAEELLVSLDGHAHDDTDAAWKAEIERRVKELDEGAVATVPWPEVRRRLFHRARRRVLRRLREGLDLQWVPAASRDDLHRG